jgi:hypothetical protein
MKVLFLIALAAGATLFTGCETTAVVEHEPYYGGSHVYYSSGRPYYYTGGVRYWGYPRGYYGGGYHGYGYGYRGYGYRNYDSHPRYSYSRNVEVERNTYVVNNNRTVYNNRTAYRGTGQSTRYRSGTVNRSSNVKVKNTYEQQGHTKKKKKGNDQA